MTSETVTNGKQNTFKCILQVEGTMSFWFIIFQAFRNPRSQRSEERLEKGRCSLGGRGSGQGILKQTGHMKVHKA